jgi:anti-sigma regulatory factor (Ser/Thr protein kinase)
MARILLIGVDPETRAGLETSPALADCIFEVARGEADSIRRLRKIVYDVAVLSPGATLDEDLAAAEEIRRVRPGVKLIILAPTATPEAVIAALRKSIFACFSAPYDAEEIAAMTRRAIDEVSWQDGIEVVSAHRGWLSVRATCRPLTAERLVAFLNELPTDLEKEERDSLMLAFREILLNAMEHGGRFDPDQVVEVSAVRTERAIVFYVRDPGPGFLIDDLRHAAVSNPPGDPVAHAEKRAQMGLRPGGFGLLLAQGIVDEMIFSERGNEVLLIKHTT